MNRIKGQFYWIFFYNCKTQDEKENLQRNLERNKGDIQYWKKYYKNKAELNSQKKVKRQLFFN